MSAKIIISDTVLTGHPMTVRTACIVGSNNLLTIADIEIKNGGFASDIAYAQSVGAKYIVRSISDIQSCLTLANQYWLSDGIMTFMPLYTNSHTLVTLTPDIIPSGIIVCGAILTAGQNCLTGYGKALEILGIDVWFGPSAESSGVNGFIAGAVYRIAQTLSTTIALARQRMRITASGGNNWNINRGYGLIDVDAALVPILERPMAINRIDNDTMSIREIFDLDSFTLPLLDETVDNIVVSCTRYDENDDTDLGTDISTLLTVNKNVGTLTGIWLSTETPAAGSYRVLGVIGNPAGTVKEEFNVYQTVTA